MACRLELFVLTCAVWLASHVQASPPKLKVSENHHFLVYDDGSPFFYLGDTAWELFHRLTREDADYYLLNRAQKGFTVIQAVAIAEFDGHTVPNAYGDLPLQNLDPALPAVRYWEHVDYIVDRADKLGMFVGLLPAWGRYWHDPIHDGKPLFTRKNAETYGEWLGRRYATRPIIWILGGDRSVENDEQKEVLRAMARGLRRGDGGAHLITFHPCGGCGSSKWFQEEAWLDFNLRQNGHSTEFTGRYDQTKLDYDRLPTKPVIDGEPIYEDHPISFAADKFGHSIAADVRRAFYWDVFSGACGHTYGNHSIWQMWTPERKPINHPLLEWKQALNQPGSDQMRLGRRLLESRPFLSRIPDDDLLVKDRIPTLVPGAGRYRFVATRDDAGSYAMIYVPVGRPFKVRMDRLSADKITAWWFDPRTGKADKIGSFSNQGEREFTPPAKGELLDWILVLDDTARHFPPPGARSLLKKQ
jgi:hypothetical protein